MPQLHGLSYLQSFSAMVTVVPRVLSNDMVAAISFGMKTVSFLSPNRYIVDPFVFSMRASDSSCATAVSVLDLNDGVFP